MPRLTDKPVDEIDTADVMGRPAPHLVHQAGDSQARPVAHRRGDEVGGRARLPAGQPGGRRHLGRTAEERRPATAPARADARRGRGGAWPGAPLAGVPRHRARVRVPRAHRLPQRRGPRYPMGGDRHRRGGLDDSRRAHEGGQGAPRSLAPRALEVLDEARRLADQRGLVFPSPTGRTPSQSTMPSLLRDLEIGAVPHGFRSSFRDRAAECTDYPREICELRWRTSTATGWRPPTGVATCSRNGAPSWTTGPATSPSGDPEVQFSGRTGRVKDRRGVHRRRVTLCAARRRSLMLPRSAARTAGSAWPWTPLAFERRSPERVPRGHRRATGQQRGDGRRVRRGIRLFGPVDQMSRHHRVQRCGPVVAACVRIGTTFQQNADVFHQTRRVPPGRRS